MFAIFEIIMINFIINHSCLSFKCKGKIICVRNIKIKKHTNNNHDKFIITVRPIFIRKIIRNNKKKKKIARNSCMTQPSP